MRRIGHWNISKGCIVPNTFHVIVGLAICEQRKQNVKDKTKNPLGSQANRDNLSRAMKKNHCRLKPIRSVQGTSMKPLRKL